MAGEKNKQETNNPGWLHWLGSRINRNRRDGASLSCRSLLEGVRLWMGRIVRWSLRSDVNPACAAEEKSAPNPEGRGKGAEHAVPASERILAEQTYLLTGCKWKPRKKSVDHSYENEGSERGATTK